MNIPYIGFDNPTLDKLPLARAGDTFVCSKCGETHELKLPDKDSHIILFYHCSGKIYLGAVQGRLVVDTKPDIRGKAGKQWS